LAAVGVQLVEGHQVAASQAQTATALGEAQRRELPFRSLDAQGPEQPALGWREQFGMTNIPSA
jgi:hypothetical protein